MLEDFRPPRLISGSQPSGELTNESDLWCPIFSMKEWLIKNTVSFLLTVMYVQYVRMRLPQGYS